MLPLSEAIKIAPPCKCIHCGNNLEWSGYGGKGWDLEISYHITYCCNKCIFEDIQSKTIIEFQVQPEVKLNNLDIILGNLNLVVDYNRNVTTISSVKAENSTIMLDHEILLRLNSAITIDYTSKSQIEETVNTLLTFK